MKRKRKVKLLLFDEWELEETESWLNEMAKQGWMLEKLTNWSAAFVESIPKNLRYRLEIAARKTRLDDEQIRLYQDSGWDYISSRRFIHVFREKEPNTALEIHTDSEVHATTIERLKKSVINRGIAILAITVISVILQLSQLRNPSSYDYLNNVGLSNLIIIILYVYLAFYMLRGMIHISILMKKLKNNESFNHEKTYKGKRISRGISLSLLTILLIIFPIILFMIDIGKQDEYMKIPDENIPVISLHEIENVNLTKVLYPTEGLQTSRYNYYIEEASILVPQQYKLVQQFIIPEESVTDGSSPYEPSIRSNRYQAQTESIASRLVEVLKAERGYDFEGFKSITLSGYDETWMIEEDSNIFIITREEDVIYDIYYSGHEQGDKLMQLLEKRKERTDI